MAARVTPAQVKEVIGTSVTDDTIVTSMIDTANLYMETNIVPLAVHSVKVLEKIELYLAAHVVAITEEVGPIRSTKLGDAEETYSTFNLGEGLASTRFGQMAIMFDTTGTLKALAASPALKAQFRVV